MKFMIQQDDLQLLKENTGHMANKMQFNSVSGRYCCVTPVLSLRKKRSVMEIWKRRKTDQLFFLMKIFVSLAERRKERQ